MIAKSLLPLIILFSTLAFATGGTSDIGFGASELGRLLSHAQILLVEKLPTIDGKELFKDEPDLSMLYVSIQNRIVDDVRSLRFEPIKKGVNLFDKRAGYPTWIRLRTQPSTRIEYNPDIEVYLKTVHSFARPDTKDTKSPHPGDVQEFLLHELGHYYGLEEDRAWTFAQKLVKKIGSHSDSPATQNSQLPKLTVVVDTVVRLRRAIKKVDEHFPEKPSCKLPADFEDVLGRAALMDPKWNRSLETMLDLLENLSSYTTASKRLTDGLCEDFNSMIEKRTSSQ